MSGITCLIHYSSIKTTTTLTRASDASFQMLLEFKRIRQSLGGENGHDEQCNGVPESLGEKELYYHRECYQKFTYAKTILKRKSIQDKDTKEIRKFKQLSCSSSDIGEGSKSDATGLFPHQCMICKKDSFKIKGKRQVLCRIITKSAENTIKQAAELRNDQDMLLTIKGVGLIAKEFHTSTVIENTHIWFGKKREV